MLKYEKPIIEVIMFSLEDVLSTSRIWTDDDDGDGREEDGDGIFSIIKLISN